MQEVPCKECENRKVGCHISCDSYKDFRAEREKEYRENEKNYSERNGIRMTRRKDRVYGVGQRIRVEHNFGNQK